MASMALEGSRNLEGSNLGGMMISSRDCHPPRAVESVMMVTGRL